MLLAIDPGTSGKLAILAEDGYQTIIDMPVEQVDTGRKTKKGNPITR